MSRVFHACARARAHPRLPLALAALALLALSPTGARAGNEDELFVGNRAAISGGTVTATVRDGSATHYNPAGLGAVERSAVDVSGSAYVLRLLSAPGFLSSEGGAREDAEVTEFVAIPTQIAYVRQLGARTVLGLGYFVPRASDLLLREHLEIGPDADGSADAGGDAPSDWALDLRITAAEYLLSAGLGRAFSDRVRLGAALVASYATDVESASLFGRTFSGEVSGSATHLTALATGSTVGTELVLGLQADLGEAFHLGITLRSPRLRLWDSSDTSFSSTIARVPPADAAADAAADGDGEAEQALLETVSMRVDEGGEELRVVRLGRLHVGVAWDLGDGTLSIGGDLQPALRDADVGVRRRTTVNGRLGYVQRLRPGLQLGAGLFSDRATEELGDGLVQATFDFYGGSAGVEIDDVHLLATGEDAGSLIFSTVFALRYAYGWGDATWVRVQPDSDAVLPFDSVPGKARMHELGLHVGSALHF